MVPKWHSPSGIIHASVTAPDGPHNFTNQAQLAAAADLQMPPSPETAAIWPPIRPGPGVDVMGVIGGPVFGQTRIVRMTV